MGILDIFKPKKLEDHFIKYSGKIVHANNSSVSVSKDDIYYLLRYQTRGDGVKVRYFQRCDGEGNPVQDAHFLRDIFSLSAEDYKNLARRISSNSFSQEELDTMLKSHQDYQGPKGVLVKIFKKGPGVKVLPLAVLNIPAVSIKRNNSH